MQNLIWILIISVLLFTRDKPGLSLPCPKTEAFTKAVFIQPTEAENSSASVDYQVDSFRSVPLVGELL